MHNIAVKIKPLVLVGQFPFYITFTPRFSLFCASIHRHVPSIHYFSSVAIFTIPSSFHWIFRSIRLIPPKVFFHSTLATEDVHNLLWCKWVNNNNNNPSMCNANIRTLSKHIDNNDSKLHCFDNLRTTGTDTVWFCLCNTFVKCCHSTKLLVERNFAFFIAYSI